MFFIGKNEEDFVVMFSQVFVYTNGRSHPWRPGYNHEDRGLLVGSHVFQCCPDGGREQL